MKRKKVSRVFELYIYMIVIEIQILYVVVTKHKYPLLHLHLANHILRMLLSTASICQGARRLFSEQCIQTVLHQDTTRKILGSPLRSRFTTSGSFGHFVSSSFVHTHTLHHFYTVNLNTQHRQIQFGSALETDTELIGACTAQV